MKDFHFENRPWGNFEQFTHNEISTVKILEVKPHSKLSLQSHQKREELWIALTNNVIVQVGNQVKSLNEGEKIFIPKETQHRLVAKEDKIKVLEISFGEFDENDNTRFEDDYGRV